MSEEILQALMQLFAIIARQDGVLINNHEKYVYNFLASQLNSNRVDDYLKIYTDFLNQSKPEVPGAEAKDKARTSMKDSVRTLSICKKINKTLAQKQKTIVLIRLLEFFKNDSNHSANRIAIVETAADVFKIEKAEFLDIKEFVFEDKDATSENEIIVGQTPDLQPACKHYISFNNYTGKCKFIHLRSINIVILKYHGSTELYLNGAVIKPETIYLFPHGSTLRFPQTSIYYSNIISFFVGEKSGDAFSFHAHIVEHKFPNGTKALNELKIEEHSGNLVGIMGASGSGKTTLLTLLSGQDKPSNGEIKINSTDLNSGNKELHGVIGYVPQDDLLIEDLTVYQNLYYNAKLCFNDLDENQTNEKIGKTLSSLGLEEIKHIKVGNALNKKISGGQRKRLNIALELLREPHIIFLDEPTSGLSSRDSENVMDLLKELTIKGKLIFVVIHQPSSDIFKMFDKMLILDKGGYAAFYGNPIESVTHFKKITHQINNDVAECNTCGSVNPETIFNLIELKEIDEYGNYTSKRKVEPKQFYEAYKQKFFNALPIENIKKTIKTSLNTPGKLKQTMFFFLRDLYSKISNKQYVLINLLEVPALVLFLSLIIKYIDTTKSSEYTFFHNYNIPAYFFMSIIAALLVGLTISAEEIYKDQKILKREKFLHLSRFSYLSSKVILLFSISLIQSALFVLIGNLVLGIQANYFSFFLMLFSVFCFSNILGLILSSTFNSPVTIYIIIPLIIIPQLILGGALFSYSKLSSLFGGGYKVPAIANAMVSRWAYEGLAVDMYINNPYNKDKYIFNKLESRFNYKLVYFIPKIEQLIKDRKIGPLYDYDENTKIIKTELAKDHTEAVELGFDKALPDFSDAASTLEYLQELNGFYSEKYNQASALKEKYLSQELKSKDAKEIEQNKLTYFNNHLDEIVTGSLEKEKIVIYNHSLVQVVDPIYKDPDGSNKILGCNTHFLSATKYFFHSMIPTYYFNLMIIWLINGLLFILLYFDGLKKLFRMVK
ncbi:MAG: ATP-binding cassette domain-containing protein [Bacteroidota bacterium]